MQYASPYGWFKGHLVDDGYGASLLIFIVLYTLGFFAACTYLWYQRHHPVIRMRKIGIALMSIIMLHVYLFLVFVYYSFKGPYPCGLEFWIMSIYLPIGIGLFQVQNQQLLVVSEGQNQLIHLDEPYRPLAGERAHGIGTFRYWMFRFKLWWTGTSKQGKYEAFVFAGMVVQFVVTLIIYNLSRQFNRYGVIDHPVTQLQCRRGWEWLPSIVWQFLWNYFFGPYLIWKIRMIRDIYHWRLQTILAVVAGLPGTPLWIAGTYSDAFAAINKYWVPPMWFAPGLITMELTTLIFPILQIIKHNRAARETFQILADFDAKHDETIGGFDGSTTIRSTGSKGKMYSMETLDHCLANNYDGLQVYASCMELNGENIVFLVKVLNFKRLWLTTFSKTDNFLTARMAMFRAALSIYVSLVHSATANYPINIESPIYAELESIFGYATTLVACRRNGSTSSSISQVTPWDEPADPGVKKAPEGFQMKPMLSSPPLYYCSNESEENIVSHGEPRETSDPLAGFVVPHQFDAHAFDAAFKSIKYMVWSETWQRYMNYKRSSGTPE